jgi:hypothetical protein
MHFHNHVVDLEGSHRGHAVLDGLNTDRTFLERGPTIAFGKIGCHGGNPHRLRCIGPDEGYAGVDRCRAKNNLHLFASEHAATAHPAFTFYRLLQLQVFLSFW